MQIEPRQSISLDSLLSLYRCRNSLTEAQEADSGRAIHKVKSYVRLRDRQGAANLCDICTRNTGPTHYLYRDEIRDPTVETSIQVTIWSLSALDCAGFEASFRPIPRFRRTQPCGIPEGFRPKALGSGFILCHTDPRID